MRFLSFLLLVLLVSCSKEELTEDIVLKDNTPTILARAAAPPCPTPQTFAFEDDSNWPEFLFGEYGEEVGLGHWDRILNCPATELPEGCEYPCDPVTYTLYPDEFGNPFVLYFDDYDPITSDGIFSAAEQQAILDNIVSLAEANAPTCPDTPFLMEPIHYNVSWTIIGGGGGITIYGVVDVTYAPQCRYVRN